MPRSTFQCAWGPTTENKAPESPTLASRLSPAADAVYRAASSASDERTGVHTSRLPSLVFRTADRQGGTYHLACTHGSEAEHADSFAFLQLMVLYPETDSQSVYDTAQTESGIELAVQPMKHERAEGFQTEHLSIRIPREMLAQHAPTAMRIRVSRADDGMAFVLDVPAAHVEALLALADDESSRHPDAHVEANEPSLAQRPLETQPALDASPLESPIVAETRPPPTSLAPAGRWAIAAGLVLIAGILAWRFLFSDGVRPIQPQQARTSSQEPTARSATPQAATEIANVAPDASLVPDEVESVRSLVGEWFKATSNNNVQDAMRFYAPAVDYYQRGVVPQAYVQSDKAQLLQRWPIQNNTIEGDITVTSGPDESRATFLFSYWLENGKQIRNGRARTLLVLQEREGRYYIVRENTIALDAAGNAQNREFYWRHESGK